MFILLQQKFLKDNFHVSFSTHDLYQMVIMKISRRIIHHYRGDDGLPWVLPCVREAETIITNKQMNHEYLGMVRR